MLTDSYPALSRLVLFADDTDPLDPPSDGDDDSGEGSGGGGNDEPTKPPPISE